MLFKINHEMIVVSIYSFAMHNCVKKSCIFLFCCCAQFEVNIIVVAAQCFERKVHGNDVFLFFYAEWQWQNELLGITIISL